MTTVHDRALLTDLYQLTMAYGYWKLGRADQPSVFHLYFRRAPFKGGYAVACGLEAALDFVRGLHFRSEELEYLASLVGGDGKPLFETGFIEYLAGLRFTGDLAGIPEGTAVFANEPLLRVTAPLAQAQILETPLLNMVNFQTLIATKSARICTAAQGESVLEFGLRRAQGPDGGVSASRAAYVGGCMGTSNVLAGHKYGIPVRGTHAHSWVMSFDGEREAFQSYAKAMPNNVILLVDTYDTMGGVELAIEVGRELEKNGHKLGGVRLDSGDLAELSIAARARLDEAGFPDAAIVASNDLDEHRITELKRRGAKIGVWGVGTRLATAYEQPALGGVYKLAALQEQDGTWTPKIKLSEQEIKLSNPGTLQVRRQFVGGKPVGDVIYDERVDQAPEGEDLLVPLIEQGKVIYDQPALESIRSRTQAQLAALPPGVTQIILDATYPVSLHPELEGRRARMILDLRGISDGEAVLR